MSSRRCAVCFYVCVCVWSDSPVPLSTSPLRLLRNTRLSSEPVSKEEKTKLKKNREVESLSGKELNPLRHPFTVHQLFMCGHISVCRSSFSSLCDHKYMKSPHLKLGVQQQTHVTVWSVSPGDQLNKHFLLIRPVNADPRQTAGPPSGEEEEGAGFNEEDHRPRGRERKSEKESGGLSLVSPFHLCLWRAFLFLLLKKQQHLVSSATSTSAVAVIGAFECPAVGSSVFSSPLVELMTWFLVCGAFSRLLV